MGRSSRLKRLRKLAERVTSNKEIHPEERGLVTQLKNGSQTRAVNDLKTIRGTYRWLKAQEKEALK